MDLCNLPSLTALRAFTALASEGSYTKAGRRLGVSHAAIKQQVAALEAALEVGLVKRNGREIVLSNEGRALAGDCERAFRRIAHSVEELRATSNARPVQVTMSPAFATRWLMPRIADFQTRYPEIMLMLSPTGQNVTLRQGEIDLAIRFCKADKLTEDHDVLLPVDLTVVGTPQLVASREVGTEADLLHFHWFQELGTNEVADWLKSRDVSINRPLMISHMPGNMILEAVQRGDGLTYTVRQWVENELASGALVSVLPGQDRGVFFLVTPPGEVRRPVRIFMAWLREQARMG